MTANQELHITHTFDVTKETLFDMWTNPPSFETLVSTSRLYCKRCKLLKSGWIFHYSQTSTDDQTQWGKFVYREMKKPNRLVYVSSFSDEKARIVRAPIHSSWPLEILNTMTFTESDRKTTLSIRGIPISANEEEHTLFRASHEGIKQGFIGTFDKLETYLKESK